jgi:hypothetical protein
MARFMGLLRERRATERLTDIHRDTIMRLGVRVGFGCAALHDALMRDLQVARIELDETWSQLRTAPNDRARSAHGLKRLPFTGNRAIEKEALKSKELARAGTGHAPSPSIAPADPIPMNGRRPRSLRDHDLAPQNRLELPALKLARPAASGAGRNCRLRLEHG